jgi:hypothetical protein
VRTSCRSVWQRLIKKSFGARPIIRKTATRRSGHPTECRARSMARCGKGQVDDQEQAHCRGFDQRAPCFTIARTLRAP